jgi:hypothetical protein
MGFPGATLSLSLTRLAVSRAVAAVFDSSACAPGATTQINSSQKVKVFWFFFSKKNILPSFFEKKEAKKLLIFIVLGPDARAVPAYVGRHGDKCTSCRCVPASAS